MKIFGNNYEEEIKGLKEINELLKKNIELLVKRLDNQSESLISIQDSLIEMAKNQATQKQSITFLLKHSEVDGDAQEDFLKMLKEINRINNIAKTKANKGDE